MWNESEEPGLFNHGWEHFWFSPNNLVVKEFIKGPFLKPKLLYPIPYVTLCQQDGDSLRLEEGVPDCWAEYLAHNSIFLRKHLTNYELMHKEDVEIVPQLRKNYRLYIGQGIPDPWTSYPYVNDSEIRNPKDVRKLLHFSNRRKENCYCCEKKFLFECPDKNSVKGCPCRDCHGRSAAFAPECGENCKCISVLRDWVLKNTDLKRRRKPRGKRCSGSDPSSSDESKTGDECPKANSLPFCECMRHYRASSDTATSEIGEESIPQKPHDRHKIYPKSQSRVCCCPYVKNNHVKRKQGSNERNLPECAKTISKQIQTDNRPVKDSKTVQTDNSKWKFPVKCQCSSKCSRCGLHQCKPPWAKIAYPAVQSLPNVCFTPNVFQNPPIICPYPFPNQVIIQKPPKHDETRKASKKHHKSRISEDGSNVETGINRKQSKPDEENTKKSEIKDPPNDPKNGEFSNKSIYYCQPSGKGFDHFKYLTDEKLRHYLQRERGPGVSNHPGSKFVNFCRGDPSVLTSKPERFKLDRLKAFSYYKPKLSDSFEESKAVYLRHGRRAPPKKLFNSSDQATMTVSEEAEKFKNESLRKPKHFKEIVESDDSRTFGFIKNGSGSYHANRRRRRLLANRKRRRKLAASGKSTILEYQALLDRLSKCPELVNKEVQAEDVEEDSQLSKKVYFSQTNPAQLGILNSYENASSKFKDVSLNSNPIIAGTLRKTEQGTVKHHLGEYSRSRLVGESMRPFAQAEMRFSKALEKLSHTNKGGTWTSSALKNIVDDLLTEKKSQEMSVSRDLFTARVNSTMMTINERFTYLQKKARPVQTSLLTIRAKNSAQQQASAKNRRLAMQMERRLSASAALKIKKKSIRQRLGIPNTPTANVRDRLTLPARGKGVRRGRGGMRGRGRSLRRSQSMQSLQGGNLRRSASMQSLNQGVPRRSRSRSRSRTRAVTPSRNRSNSVNRQLQRSPSVGRQRRFSTGSFGAPVIGLGRGGKRIPANVRNQRLRNKGNKFGRNQRGAGNPGRIRGGRGNFQRKGPGGRAQLRGGRRGRGRSGIRDRLIRGNMGTKVILPTKEELDKQLEQYMANAKSDVDKEIDAYIKESGVNDL